MKKALSTILATMVVAGVATVPAFAAMPGNAKASTVAIEDINPATDIVDSDGHTYTDAQYVDGKLTVDNVVPNSTIYVKVPEGDQSFDSNTIVRSDLKKSSLFTFKSTKSTNSKLVGSIDWETEKSVNGVRGNWIKIAVNDNTSTKEQKFTGTVTFKAKKSTNDTASNNGFDSAASVMVGDTLKMDITLWIINPTVGNDDSVDTGDRIVFDPESNEKNSLVWGDDRAALKFNAEDDASKFYARLSTKANMSIYNKYADKQNAELWFYDFVGNPTIPSTTRATLTLGIPWEEDSAYEAPISDCHIYQLSNDGTLVDVTSQFTYSDSDADIEGWSIKTRTLGTYVLSDKKLDLGEDTSSSSSDDSSSDVDSTASKVPSGGKDLPETGANDMINVAVAGVVLSIVAAGAVAFRKVQK